MKKSILIISIACVSMIVANEFVVQPSKKKRSHSQLKETVAHKQAQVLHHIADVIGKLSRVQQIILDDAQALLQQKKGTLFVSKDCEALQDYQDMLDHLLCSCNHMSRECRSELQNREIIVAQTV